MFLSINTHSSEPLHAQISRQVRVRILVGDLKWGDPLPSIRTLAADNGISVITVVRAYDDLQREGLIVSTRRQGFEVAEVRESERKQLAEQRTYEVIRTTVHEGLTMGLKQEDMLRLLQRAIHEVKPEQNPSRGKGGKGA